MAKRRRKRNPESLSPRLLNHLDSLLELMDKVGSKADYLSGYTKNTRLGKLLQGVGTSMEKFSEAIGEEIDNE